MNTAKPIKLLHASDLHLCVLPEDRREERLAVLGEICEKARACDVLILAGDIFHSAADGEDRKLREAFKDKLALLGKTPVLIIPGNHDVLRAKGARHPLDGRHAYGENVKLLAKRPFDRVTLPGTGEVVFYGVPYQEGPPASELLADIPAAKGELRVGILHGTATGSRNLAMYSCFEEGDDLLIENGDLEKAGFRYAALGHIHKPEIWPLADGAVASYSGSPSMVSVKDEAPRTVNSVEIDAATGGVKVEAVPLETAARSRRKTFFVLPGREEIVAAPAGEYIKGLDANVRPTLYLHGLGSRRKIDEVREKIERDFAKRALTPVVKTKADLLEDDALEDTGLIKDFMDLMSARAAKAEDERALEKIAQATLVGWYALTGETKKLEEIRDKAEEVESEAL